MLYSHLFYTYINMYNNFLVRNSVRKIHAGSLISIGDNRCKFFYTNSHRSELVIPHKKYLRNLALECENKNRRILKCKHLDLRILKQFVACFFYVFNTGGTFALYSLLCRNSKMGLLKTYCKSVHDNSISSYHSKTSTDQETRTSLLIKQFFKKNYSSRVVLLLVVLLGTSMVIGDGILTPTMSGTMEIYAEFCLYSNFSENILTTMIIV